MHQEKEKTILEVSVDRLNEKGVFMAEQILNIFHNTLEEHKLLFWKTYSAPEFSFEIANTNGKIRFFFVVESKYAEFVENQIYAHYPNIEIRTVPDYLDGRPGFIGRIKLAKPYIAPIKIYTDFKEKTEKESIDPFSSITSALQKGDKNNTKVFQINFMPIHDSKWKDPKQIDVINSHYPKWVKELFLSQYGLAWKILFSPILLLVRFVSLVIHPGGHDEHDDKNGKTKEKENPYERKLAGFGYACGINFGYFGSDAMTAKVTVRESVSSLNIFSIPGQNSFKLSGEILPDTHDVLKNRSNSHKIILNSSELA